MACSYPKVAISKHFGQPKHQPLIEAQSLIHGKLPHFFVTAVIERFNYKETSHSKALEMNKGNFESVFQ